MAKPVDIYRILAYNCGAWVAIRAGCLRTVPCRNPRAKTKEKGVFRLVPKTLFVGNLPWSATDDDLSQVFSQHARVISARIVTDRETGRSRGFGFVEVEDDGAQTAVDALNGYMLGGRPITVNEARPREDRGPRRRDY